MNNKKYRHLLSGPYIFWSVAFIIIPLCMVFYYGLTDKTGAFTLANVAAIASAEHSKALWLSIALSLISTLICFLLAYPLAMILANMNVNQHRDVYKRQLRYPGITGLAVCLLVIAGKMLNAGPDMLRLNSVNLGSRHLSCDQRIFGIIFKVSSAQRASVYIPVSYTHLDVYKRQDDRYWTAVPGS